MLTKTFCDRCGIEITLATSFNFIERWRIVNRKDLGIVEDNTKQRLIFCDDCYSGFDLWFHHKSNKRVTV